MRSKENLELTIVPNVDQDNKQPFLDRLCQISHSILQSSRIDLKIRGLNELQLHLRGFDALFGGEVIQDYPTLEPHVRNIQRCFVTRKPFCCSSFCFSAPVSLEEKSIAILNQIETPNLTCIFNLLNKNNESTLSPKKVKIIACYGGEVKDVAYYRSSF